MADTVQMDHRQFKGGLNTLWNIFSTNLSIWWLCSCNWRECASASNSSFPGPSTGGSAGLVSFKAEFPRIPGKRDIYYNYQPMYGESEGAVKVHDEQLKGHGSNLTSDTWQRRWTRYFTPQSPTRKVTRNNVPQIDLNLHSTLHCLGDVTHPTLRFLTYWMTWCTLSTM